MSNPHIPKMPRVHIIELEDMKDLIKLSNKSILKIEIEDYKIYYIGEANENFIGLHIFITKRNYQPYLTIDDKDRLLEFTTVPIGKHFIPICRVKYDLWISSILYSYLIKRGYIEIKEEKN